jgi:predicted acylesterase/phospholipase RssA
MPDQPNIAPPSTDIALCFSGGGYRAAAFHLGALEMLHELGMQDRIKYFSTASGGTIVAMKYVLEMIAGTDFQTFTNDFKKFLLSHNVIKDSFETLTAKRFPDQKDDLSLIRAAAGLYDEHLTGGLNIRHLKDNAVGNGRYNDLIFNATEFHTGGGFRFRVTNNPELKFGSGTFNVKPELQGEILLGDVVAASSCFPGAFEPIRFPEDFDLPDRELAKVPFVGKNSDITSIPMMDGGIFDNQGVAGLMTSYEKTVPFEFVLISDTTPKADTILDPRMAKKGRGLSVGLTFCAVLAVLLVIFISSVVLIGTSIRSLPVTSTLRFISIELAAVFSALVSGALIAVLVIARRWLGSLDIMGTRFPIWSYLRGLTVSDVVSLVRTRYDSARVLLFNVFMKRIRDLNTKTVLAAVNEDTHLNLLHGKNVFSLIYHLEDRKEKPVADDPDIQITDRMVAISVAAGKVPTMLWLTPAQLEVLVECGRITTCLALLRLTWSKWQKATADAQEAQQIPKDAELPRPTDPASPLHAEYQKYKYQWNELVEAKPADIV